MKRPRTFCWNNPLGPHFIYQPRQMPSGMKVHPVSGGLSPIPSVTVVFKALPKKLEKVFLVKNFQELVKIETDICYQQCQ